jgi:Tfp pilus assembly protein PilF
VSPFLRRILFAGLLCLLVSACVSNQVLAESPESGESTKHSFQSIYFFTAASYMRAGGNLSAADELYRKAMEYDPGSREIRKSLLLNTMDMYEAGLAEESDVRELITVCSEELDPDEDILYACYKFYSRIEDIEAMEKTLRDIEDNFPGPRASIQRFLFEGMHRDVTDTGYLDQALDMSQNEPNYLLVLANIYTYYDKEKEKQALLRYHEIAPSDESHQRLAGYIVKNKDLDLARQYFSELEYPEDRDYMLYFAETSIREQSLGTFLEFAPRFLDTGDLDLISALAFSALTSGNKGILDEIGKILPDLLAPRREKQPLYALLTANSIHALETHPLDPIVGKLREIQYFDDILTYYSFAVTADISDDWVDPGPLVYQRFIAQVENRLEDAEPGRYLRSIAIAVQDSTYRDFVDTRYELLLYLKQRYVLSEEDYEFLLQYYYRNDMPSQRRTLLEEAVGEYPDNPLFCNDLGYSLLLEGEDPEKAHTLIRRAVAVEPENPYYLDSLAWYHYLEGNYERALELTKVPQNTEDIPAEIAWHIGAIYLALEDYTNARLWLQKCIDIGGDPENTAKAEQALKQLP